MAGIYIPGMEIPTDENEAIDIRLFSDGNVAAWNKQKGWVPYSAILVPDHGRLIDADALENRVVPASRLFEIPNANVVVLGAIKAAPTIIPPSGGKEDE